MPGFYGVRDQVAAAHQQRTSLPVRLDRLADLWNLYFSIKHHEGIMFDEQDREYFAKRAADCRNKEASARDPSIRKIHREMAEEYERRSHGEQAKVVARP